MKRFRQHKWAIPVAAAVMVLVLGAVAFAATGTTDTTGAAGAGPAVTSPGGGQDGQAGALRVRAGRGLRGLVEKFKDEFEGLEPGSQEFRDKAKELMEQQRVTKQERRESMLNLVREKMTPEEQAQLDTLLQQATTQREALQKAREDLGATSKQIRALIDKYLAPGDGAAGTGLRGGSTTSTVTL
jgi:hypothetical protein